MFPYPRNFKFFCASSQSVIPSLPSHTVSVSITKTQSCLFSSEILYGWYLIEYLFYIWLLKQNIIFFRLMHVTVFISTSVLFILSTTQLFECATMYSSIHLVMGTYLVYFQIFASIMLMIYFFFLMWSYVVIFLGLLPKSSIARATYLKIYSLNTLQILF